MVIQDIRMKKTVLAILLVVMLISSVFADAQISGDIKSAIKFDFSDADAMTLKYGIRGTFASLTLDFNSLSLSKSGTKKPYVDISASAALKLETPGHSIDWASYSATIDNTNVTYLIRLNKFNLVADVAGKELVVDFLHNNIGSDWAKSPINSFTYTTELFKKEGDEHVPNPDAWSPDCSGEEPFSYNIKLLNERVVEFKVIPGFTLTWNKWSVGMSFDLLFGSAKKQDYNLLSIGVATPEFIFADERANFSSNLEVYYAHDVNDVKATRDVIVGGSAKAGYKDSTFDFKVATDYGFTIETDSEISENNGIELDGLDVATSLGAWIAEANVYYTTKSPLIALRTDVFESKITEPFYECLIPIKDVLSAGISFDLHKMSTPVPLNVSATLWDALYSKEERFDLYDLVTKGTEGAIPPFEDFEMIQRYGRDLDIDAKTDAFEKQHITLLWVFGHRLLQTKEFGVGIELTYGKLRFGDVASWTVDSKYLWDKAYIEYKPEEYRAYGAIQVGKTFADDSDMEFAAIAGISSDKVVEIATVGAEFRYNAFSFEAEGFSMTKDFTVYCKVEF